MLSHDFKEGKFPSLASVMGQPEPAAPGMSDDVEGTLRRWELALLQADAGPQTRLVKIGEG